jgi:hypothetical protein
MSSQGDVMSVDVTVKGSSDKETVIPLLLTFNNHPIFLLISCFVIDDTIIGDVNKITRIEKVESEYNYCVFSLNFDDNPRILTYLGKTTGMIDVPESSLRMTDIIFIPEDVFVRLSFGNPGDPFFLTILGERMVDISPIEKLFPRGFFVYAMPLIPKILYEKRSRVYFNSTRWNEFFSAKFRTRIEMRAIDLDLSCIGSMSSSMFANGESISFTLPYHETVKNYSTMLLCKHIHAGIFLHEVDLLSDDGDTYTLSLLKKPLDVLAMLTGYGWIDIVCVSLNKKPMTGRAVSLISGTSLP